MRHIHMKHNDLVPITCPKCEFFAVKMDILSQHISTDHEHVIGSLKVFQGQTYINCPCCHVVTTRGKDLSFHINQEHGKQYSNEILAELIKRHFESNEGNERSRHKTLRPEVTKTNPP